MYVVAGHFATDDFQLMFHRDLPDQVAYTNGHLSRQHRFSVFRDPYQMDLQIGGRVRAMPVASHATTLHDSSLRLKARDFDHPRWGHYIDMAALPTSHRSIELSSIEKRPYSSGARFKNGDSLLARITPCLENGKSAFVNCLQKDEVAAGSTEFIVIAAKREIEADFVYYASRLPEFSSMQFRGWKAHPEDNAFLIIR